MFMFKFLTLLTVIVGSDAYGGYSLLTDNRPNFSVDLNIPRNQIISGWSYISLDKMSDLDFPQFGDEIEKMVPKNKLSKAKVMAYKMAVRLPVLPSYVTRELVTNKSFLTRVNGVEFIPGKELVTTFGKNFQGHVSLPFNRALLDLDVSFIDLNVDSHLIGYQQLVDRYDQGDEQLGPPTKIVVCKAKDLSGGYLHGMYNVFKIYPLGKSEVLLVLYTLSLVDGGNLLIKLAGSGKIKSAIDESSLSFVEEFN